VKSALTRAGLRFGLPAAALMLVGCAQAPKPLYQWGGYQVQLYEHFKGDGTSPLDQLGALEAQLQQTQASGGAVPPGLHAHMGLLELKLGRADEAFAHLQTEKALFPESTAYVDWLLRRAKADQP
jgi:hypothetical protein